MKYPAVSGAATDAQFTVTYSGGTATVPVDQTQNAGTWVSLGKWAFTKADTNQQVSLAENSGGTVVADADLRSLCAALAYSTSDIHIKRRMTIAVNPVTTWNLPRVLLGLVPETAPVLAELAVEAYDIDPDELGLPEETPRRLKPEYRDRANRPMSPIEQVEAYSS